MQKKAAIIPNLAAILTSAKRVPGDGSRIFADGRLVHQKGFDLLLQAFAKVAGDTPRTGLTIFGEGRDRDALEAQARALAIDDRVVFAGLTEEPGA